MNDEEKEIYKNLTNAEKEYVEIIKNGGTIDDLQPFIERQPWLKKTCVEYDGKLIPDDFFYKEDGEKIWRVDTPGEYGPILFSFDKKTVFSYWTDYPQKLTKEQIEIFKKEYPELAALKTA